MKRYSFGTHARLTRPLRLMPWQFMEPGEVLIEVAEGYENEARGELALTDRRVAFVVDPPPGAILWSVPLEEIGAASVLGRSVPRGSAITLRMSRSESDECGLRLQLSDGGLGRGHEITAAIECARDRLMAVGCTSDGEHEVMEVPLDVVCEPAVSDLVKKRGGRLYVWTAPISKSLGVPCASLAKPAGVSLAHVDDVADFDLLVSEELLWTSCLKLRLRKWSRAAVVVQKATAAQDATDA